MLRTMFVRPLEILAQMEIPSLRSREHVIASMRLGSVRMESTLKLLKLLMKPRS